MSKNEGDRRREEARRLRDRLRSENRHQDAEIIQRLIRTSETSRGTNRQLWEDNQALRARLRQAESDAAR